MILNLTDVSSEPLQSQIVRQVRAKILSNEIPAGESLPSIRALARQERVSVITVQRAYEALLRDELIHARRGKGFFVSELHDKRKKEMAKQKLTESMRPVIIAALAEGLSAGDIEPVLSELLEENS